MITLLHGNYIEASRAEYIQLKDAAKGKDVRVLDGRTTDESALTQALESSSLFGGGTVVFIENLFGKLGRKVKVIESLGKILSGSGADVVMWENKEVGATVIKSLGHADVRLFKLPSIIFQFLDAVAPRAQNTTLGIYAKLVETEAPELVYSMLVRRMRQLIEIADGLTPEGMRGWQASRLTRQAKLFTMDKLLMMYKNLLDSEYSVKNGSSPFTLTQCTERFLAAL